MTQNRLLECVTSTPEPADTIFRRFAGIDKRKSLAHKPRRLRGEIGRVLERMAERGEISRAIGDSENHPIPVFWRDDSPRIDDRGALLDQS